MLFKCAYLMVADGKFWKKIGFWEGYLRQKSTKKISKMQKGSLRKQIKIIHRLH